jgi:hypothetical protein
VAVGQEDHAPVACRAGAGGLQDGEEFTRRLVLVCRPGTGLLSG